MNCGRRGAVWLLLIALCLPGGCDASTSVPECDRLQHFSCDCFPLCQMDYVDIVDSRDAARCDQALRSAFAYWQTCAGKCGLNCQYGWGSCAISAYKSLGLDPGQQCAPAAADAGAD